jgi:DNA-binding MarR family transcriptional regulator
MTTDETVLHNLSSISPVTATSTRTKAPSPAAPRQADESRRSHTPAADERIAHFVKDTFREFLRALQAGLREHSVLYGHWTFLYILWQTDGMTQRQLSEQAGVYDSTTVGALRSMEELGYIFRRKMPENRKEVRVFLAPKGAALKAVLMPVVENLNSAALEGIPEHDIEVTKRTLTALAGNLARFKSGAERGTAPDL